MENKELLSCPFCGGEATLEKSSHGHDVMSVYAICIHCGASGEPFGYNYWRYEQELKQREKAIKAWNTRTNTIPVGNGKDYTVVNE